jgi:hypothetical protein
MTTYVVRKHWCDPESETLAAESCAGLAYQQAMALLMEANRDYEAFDLVEIDTETGEAECIDCVSWEPRG